MAENEKNVFDDADNTSSNTNSASSNTSSSSNSSSSSSSDDKDKQIADLKQQVKDLQAQLAKANGSNSQDDSDDDKGKNSNKSDSVEREIEKLKAERDKYKSKVEGDSFNNAVDDRIELIDEAKKILGDSYDFRGKSDKQIKIDSIKKADSTIDVEDKPDAYYDGIFEVIKNRKTGVVGYPRQETLSDAADDTVNKAKQARANLYYSKNK